MKKLFASVLACAMVASMAVQSFAAAPIEIGKAKPAAYLDNRDDLEDRSVYSDAIGGGDAVKTGSHSISFENIRPDKTYWVPIAAFDTLQFLDSNNNVQATLGSLDEIGDKDLFKVSYDKDGSGKSLIKSISIVSEKNKDDDFENRVLDNSGNDTTTTGYGRTAWFKVTTNQTFDDSEKKAKIEVTIKPKKTLKSKYASDTFNYVKGTDVDTSAKLVLNLTFWVKNYEAEGEDFDAEAGDGFVFKATSNEENTIVYGDDRAAIYFNADDDADKFYAKLSTSANWSIINQYGDPADADLWFYDFVGNRTIPSTSRATLTLGIPWDEDDNYVPNPEDCYLYRVNTDGTLTDISSTFTFDEDNDTTTGIAGWTIKTRTLGTYVLSDIELDID